MAVTIFFLCSHDWKFILEMCLKTHLFYNLWACALVFCLSMPRTSECIQSYPAGIIGHFVVFKKTYGFLLQTEDIILPCN